MCLKRFKSVQALDFYSSFSNTYVQFRCTGIHAVTFFVQDSLNSFINTDNRAWCTLVSFSRWLKRRWQRKMEQTRRSVQLSSIQIPELLDPAFVPSLQRQLSGTPLKIYVHPWQSHLSQFYIDCLDQTCLMEAEGIATVFFINLCSIVTLPCHFSNQVWR